MIELTRNICNYFRRSTQHEWLVTNGLGGYASGTVSSILTRRYHGLLFVPTDPPLGRTLLLTKIDDTITYQQQQYPLFSNSWSEGTSYQNGFIHLDRFHLEGTTPVWTYALGDAIIEKRIWMAVGENKSYLRYDFVRGQGQLNLSLKLLANHRNHHHLTQGGRQFQTETIENGLKVVDPANELPLYLYTDRGRAIATHIWYRNYYLSIEAYRGQDTTEDHLYVGVIEAELSVGESLTFLAMTEPLSEDSAELNGHLTYQKRVVYENSLLERAKTLFATPLPEPIQQLILAADQFIVRRDLPEMGEGRTILAGYHWFSDWGRDTMISLHGLTLTTGRFEVARNILLTFAQFVDQGMLPNRLLSGVAPEYNTVDATLWYFEAIRAYYDATGDELLLKELYPTLVDIIVWHQRGTRYNIHQDPTDRLIYAGESGVQLTWMDAKVDDWVVTPRIGKPVEINALWYNAICCMREWAEHLGESSVFYATEAQKIRQGFTRFWNYEKGCCYDVIGGPGGLSAEIRPNQLLAVSLTHSPLTLQQQKSIVDVCQRDLVTPHGLRSLATYEPGFIGRYGGTIYERDAAYHQGTVWGWLIGPFVAAHLRVYQDKAVARSFLAPLLRHLNEHGIGSISEIFDGMPPFTPRGCIAQAWSVAEILRIWQLTCD